MFLRYKKKKRVTPQINFKVLRAASFYTLILPYFAWVKTKDSFVGWWCSVLFFPAYTHALRETSPTFLRFIGFDGCFHATTKPGQQRPRREGMHHSWWLIVKAVPSTCREWTLWCLKKAPHPLCYCVCANLTFSNITNQTETIGILTQLYIRMYDIHERVNVHAADSLSPVAT